MTQSFGWRTFSSMVTEPMESATMWPEVGFLMFSMCPRMSASTVDYSKTRSHMESKVQFSSTRFSV